MSGPVLEVLDAGPQITVQDAGRPGWMRHGVTQGGAMDIRAMEEGRVLLNNEPDRALLEMVAMGGKFCTRKKPITAALTGARFSVTLDGNAIDWQTSFTINPGEVLEIGQPIDGNYGYLSVGGGISTLPVLGSRSTHLRAKFGGHEGRSLMAGDLLPIGPQKNGISDFMLPASHSKRRTDFQILWGAQAHLFSVKERRRFTETGFCISHEMDRMGARLKTEEYPVRIENGLEAISDAVALGDIQIPGNGIPIVLLKDRQPTGGYPRIATIIGADMPDFVQLPPGSPVRFRPVTEEDAVTALRDFRSNLSELPNRLKPSVRKKGYLENLSSQNLISGVVKDGDELPWEISQ